MRPLLQTADAFFAVGTRFNEAMTYGWSMPVPDTSIRIDIDPHESLRSPIPVSLFLEGDARSTMRQLLRELSGCSPRTQPAP